LSRYYAAATTSTACPRWARVSAVGTDQKGAVAAIVGSAYRGE